MKSSLEKHPLISGIISSILASVIMNIVKPLNGIDFNLSISTTTTPEFLTLSIPLWIPISLLVGVAFFFFSMFSSKKSQTKLNCDSCNQLSTLKSEYSTTQEKLNELNHSVQSQQRFDQAFQNLVDNMDAAASIQIFQISTNVDEIYNPNDMVTITVKCLHSFQHKDSNVNCMQQTLFHLKKKYFNAVKELSKECNDYYFNTHAPKDVSRDEALQEKAREIIDLLTKELNSIHSIDNIEESHFVYYRLLILVYTLLSPQDSISCTQLLDAEKEEIEECLRNGMRTGILGAFFSERLYSFLNNHTVTKKDRGYFAVPFSYKENKDWYIVVALERAKIHLREKEEWVDRCSIYCDEIKECLTSQID